MQTALTSWGRLNRVALIVNVIQAVSYACNQWQALRRYTEDGRLTIDNNVSERTLRHQAIGRKNRLFLGSEAAGPRAAVLYTVLAGAKRHRIEPLGISSGTPPTAACRRSPPGRDAARSLGGRASRGRAEVSARRITPQRGSPAGPPKSPPHVCQCPPLTGPPVGPNHPFRYLGPGANGNAAVRTAHVSYSGRMWNIARCLVGVVRTGSA